MRVLSRDVNRRVGRALHTWNMLGEGDRVMVAVSGGIDSLVLAWLLRFWRAKAPIHYDLLPVHIDMEPGEKGPGAAALAVQSILADLDLPLSILPTCWRPPSGAKTDDSARRDVCFTCARNRRRQLFAFAHEKGCGKLALGHHRDDIIETFFLNICYAGNISTMVPRQELFEGRLSLIRPLSLLDKSDIRAIAKRLDLEPVRTDCPVSEKTRRGDIRQVLETIYQVIPDARGSIFAALGNVRHGYLLDSASGSAGLGSVCEPRHQE